MRTNYVRSIRYTPTKTPTLTEVIRDNITDLYDPDFGVKSADIPVLDDVVKSLMTDSDKADYFFESVTLWGDSADFVDFMVKIMEMHKDMPEVQEITRCLRMTAQDTLERLSATISEEYYMAEAAEKGYADEPVYLDDYRSKKEINYEYS